MAERIRDEEDARLAALFRAEPIADNGFSERITRKIRRRLWLRRLTIPLAAAVGGAIALKPLGSLATMLFGFVRALPFDFVSTTANWIPSLPVIVIGGMLLAVLLLGVRLFEE